MGIVLKISRYFGYVMALTVMLSVSSCEDKLGGTSDILMDSQKADCNAGSISLKVRASGKWVLSLSFPDGEPWAELNTTTGSGSRDGIVLTYGENKGTNSRICKIILTTKDADAVRDFVQLSKDDAEQEAKGVPVWLELPAVSDGLDYYNHHFTKGGKSYRNYSFGWDKNNLVAHWVAYPLCKFYLDGSNPKSIWMYDPDVPQDEQPRLDKSYNGGKVYERGHQIPNADRYVCSEANQQTYYFTNQTPQLASFNGPIWGQLEGKVRSYAEKTDTIYIVTGCTLAGSLGKERDNDGKYITVPGGYFKALLRYNKSAEIYAAAGVFMDHKASFTGQWKDYFMSIDELEAKVGIDFFPNLVSILGEKAAAEIEAEDPHNVSFWNIN